VRALFNHDPSKLLGRTPDTLKLSTDSNRLEFEILLPDTTVANDVRALVEAGMITGASFGFIAGQDSWSRLKDGRQLRSHTSISKLVDVSPVTFPAYSGASVQLRSLPTVSNSGRSQLVRVRARGLHLGV
jgi:HK97 family phage prohead protease